MVRFCFISVIFLFFFFTLNGQGKIVLVGGGSEEENGWSDQPYIWAINHSSNKKVAVISYSDEDNWIPSYFKSLGAVEADNIKIENRLTADLQSTYDQLMEYDVFFFKGGDQSIYYASYKDTKTEDAIVNKFNEGGVIAGTSAGMAILSQIIFSAEAGTVYPDDALQNLNDVDITLRNDFLPFLPGTIVDSHFTERGRVGRLIPFMAKWFIANNEQLTGIGVDDRTALCIDENNIATILGTGSVSFFRAESFSVYNNKVPLTDSVHVIQLLHGHTFDLLQHEVIDGPDDIIDPQINSENGNFRVLLSGSEGLSTNSDLLFHLVNEMGNVTDSVVVVTADGKGSAFVQRLQSLGAKVAKVETNGSNNDPSQAELRNFIRHSKKILFVENDDDDLFSFLKDGTTGELLKNHLRRNGITSAFIGEDSRYAGKTFVTNHLTDKFAAYYGRLNFERGLSLLSTSVIMSNTYDAVTSDYYENTTASIPYEMIADSVKYGIYLNRNSYLEFYQENSFSYFQSTGNMPTIVAINSGTKTAFADQTVNGTSARNYTGFEEMQYVLLGGENKLQVGVPNPSNDEPYEFETPVLGVENKISDLFCSIFPNPSQTGKFNVLTNVSGKLFVSVANSTGKIIIQKNLENNKSCIDLASFADGIYFVLIDSEFKRYIVKVIKGF